MREFKRLFPTKRSMAPQLLAEDTVLLGEEPSVEIDVSSGRIRLTYRFPGFYLSDDDKEIEGELHPFEQVTIATTGELVESGRPRLPSFGRYLQIPRGHRYEVASVHCDDPVEFEGVLVAPAQANVTDAVEEHELEYDEAFYASEQPYPDQAAVVSGPYEVDGYTNLLVHVCPFRYVPGQRHLTAFSTVEINIDVSAVGSDEDDLGVCDLVDDMKAYGNLMVNPSRGIQESLRLAPPVGRSPLPIVQVGPELLIIHDDELREPAARLAAWKERKGIRCELVAMSRIGSTVSDLKEHIRARRRPVPTLGLPRLRYVLLFGDVDAIPTELIRDNATDYYYSTSEDASEVGELRFPWLALGRIPMRSTEDADAVVAQIIRYERQPPVESSYYQRMTFSGFIQDSDLNGRADRRYVKTLEDIREHMISLGFDVERVYVTNNPELVGHPSPEYWDGTPIPQDVLASIVDSPVATRQLLEATEEGRAIVAHRDHGLTAGWHEPPFRQSHLESVSGSVPSIFYSLNCQTGWFDIAGGKESFAETMLRIDAGAPSLIAATRDSHSYLNDDLMRALFDGMWGGVLPTFPDDATASYPIRFNRLGDILNYAKAYLPVGQAGGQASIQDHFEIYHVIGDPTLELWYEEPVRIRLQSWLMGAPSPARSLLVIRLSSVPMGSVVTVWYGDRLVKRVEPSSPFISLPIRNLIEAGALPQSFETSAALPRLPRLVVSFKAPGCLYTEVRPQHVQRPSTPVAPVELATPVRSARAAKPARAARPTRAAKPTRSAKRAKKPR